MLMELETGGNIRSHCSEGTQDCLRTDFENCWAGLCCAVPCCAVLCRAVPCRAASCCAVLGHAVLCCARVVSTTSYATFHNTTRRQAAAHACIVCKHDAMSRFEEGKASDQWFASCSQLLQSRWQAPNGTLYPHLTPSPQPNPSHPTPTLVRLTRIHNRFLRSRYCLPRCSCIDTNCCQSCKAQCSHAHHKSAMLFHFV